MSKDKNMTPHCSSSNELKEYLQRKATMHNSYKYYAKIEYIRSIVKDKVLYLTTGDSWNDSLDRDNFTSKNNKLINFGKCFSFSQDENIAMWMLYGGIYHSGAMVDFTKYGMNNIVKCHQITLGKLNDCGFHEILTLDNSEFSVQLIDILYCNEKTGYIKRSDEQALNVEHTVLEPLKPYIKPYPWNYENECRLIVSVKRKIVPSECNAIKIDLSKINLGKSLQRAYHCPDYSGEIEKGFKFSNLHGCVKWELRDKKCINCKCFSNSSNLN